MLTDAELADLDAYLSARAEVTPEVSGDRSPVIHDIDLGSRGHRRLMEPTITALLAEVRSLRAQREAVLALCSEYLDGFDASTNHEIRMRNSARAAVASRFREALGVTE